LDVAFDSDDLVLAALRVNLSPEAWERRLAEARGHLAVIHAVEAAIAEGRSETRAIVEFGAGIDRATYRRLRVHFRESGFAGLIDQRPALPQTPLKATPEVRQVVCALRELDPDVAVERIAEVVERRFGVVVSTTVIKEILREEGLNRPRGGGVHPGVLRARAPASAPPAEELVFGGAMILWAADEVAGYSASLASAICEAAMAAVAAASAPLPRPEADGARDGRGRFTATYNKANLKGEARLGPAFRSVVEKRREVNLGARRLATEGLETIRRKNQALLLLPLLTDNGRTVQVDDYRAHHGLAQLCGLGYTGETLERFLRDGKYLGLADPMMNWHTGFWMAREPRGEGGTAVAFMLYIDGTNKPLWTHHFTKSGKVSANGRLMPCLDQVLVHTGTGTPVYFETFSGHASLVKNALAALVAVEKKVGTGWQADRIVVMDAEACSVGLFRAFAAATPKRDLITLLKPSLVPALSEFRKLSAWEPYRAGDEVADGHITLRDSKDKTLHEFRAVLIRRLRAGKTSVLVTSVEATELTTREVAEAYFKRWSAQELRFKTFGAANFKGVAGYGKQLVENVAVVTELDKIPAQRRRVQTRIEGQVGVVTNAYAALKDARSAVKAAQKRRTKQDGQVAAELFKENPDPNIVCARVDVVIGERDHLATAEAAVAAAEVDHKLAVEKLAALGLELPRLDEKEALLTSRKEIYRADVELDRIVSVYKLGFVLLCELALREFFAGLNISLANFMRQILTLPAKRVVEGYQEFIQLASPPNTDIRAALEGACARINALKMRRNGLVLRLSVAPSPTGQQRRSRSTS
jgi:transposase